MLVNLQMYLFSKGEDKEISVWDKLGNKVQDVRTFISKKLVG